MDLVKRVQRLQHAFVGVGEVQFVLAIVVEEELVRFDEQLVAGLLAVIGGKCFPHQHNHAIADVARDNLVGKARPPELLQGRIHTVAEILRRIDQRAIQIKHQQLQLIHRQRT